MTGIAEIHFLPAEALPPAANIRAASVGPTFDAIAGDGSVCRVVFDRKTLIIDRDVGGLNCRVSLPGCFYDSVTLNILQAGYSVALVNNDPALTLTIGVLDNLGSALDLRDDISRQFRLPALSKARDGEISGDDRKLGAIVVRDNHQRRGSLAAGRRPRFLARRKSGRDPGNDPISGREIIARH